MGGAGRTVVLALLIISEGACSPMRLRIKADIDLEIPPPWSIGVCPYLHTHPAPMGALIRGERIGE